tara:strand:- start:1218 stop:1634 length:417 start_codon:yes stop_codon:yes gene_type:complete
MENYGEINLVNINNNDFWHLYTIIETLNSGFLLKNRALILNAYKNNNLYGFRINETKKMFNNNSRKDDIFCDKLVNYETFYLIICLVIKNNSGNKEIIFIHDNVKNNVIYNKLINILNENKSTEKYSYLNSLVKKIIG